MDNENEITDEQLDALLRDVKVPDDLKQVLRDIPVQDARAQAIHAKRRDSAKSKTSTPIVLALAASIAAICCLSVWIMFQSSVRELANSNRDSIQEPRIDNPPTVDELLAEIKADADVIENSLNELDIRTLTTKLGRLRSKNASLTEQREVDSLILAVATEASGTFGASDKFVRSDMAWLVENYPNSRGASIASQFLDQ